jgi:hypothetical protein
MTEHPILECEACQRNFEAQLPLTRRSLACSGLMFLVEQCPHCGDSRAYLRTAYAFAARPHPLTA